MEKIIIENNILPELGLSTLLTTGQDSFIHSHPYYEIFFITYGDITHVLNSVKRNLSIGDLIILKPSDIHYFQRQNSNAIHRDLMINVDFFKSICDLIPSAEKIIHDSNNILQIRLDKVEIEHLEKIINDFVNSRNVVIKKSLGVNLISEIITKFLIQYHTSPKSNQSSTSTSLLQNILETINRSDSLPLSISEIIKPFGYTHSYLCKFFKKETGLTLTQYFNNVRLQHAVYYLEHTTMTIQEICERVGLNSTSYFNKIFKKEFHLSPSKYLKQRKHFNI